MSFTTPAPPAGLRPHRETRPTPAGAVAATPPKVTLDLDKQPFRSAVQQLCAQAGVGVASSAPGGPVQPATVDPKDPPGPYAVVGPFLFKVKRIERTRGLAFDGPSGSAPSAGPSRRSPAGAAAPGPSASSTSS